MVREKKKYEYPELEIIRLQSHDVIVTSSLSNDDELTYDPDGWA